MSKTVLGNDPFLRGAALRTPVSPPVSPPPPPAPEEPPRSAAVDEAPAPQAELAVPIPREPGPKTSRLPAQALGALAVARTLLQQTLEDPRVKAAMETARGVAHAITAGLGKAGASELDVFGKDERLSRELAGLGDFLYDKYWRVSVDGAGVIPKGPAILVSNHAGALPLDGPILAGAIRRERPDVREPRWLVEDQIFYAPFIGSLFNRLGAIRASPENALRLLQERRPVVVFPEGILGLGKPLTERYQLQRFGRGGFVKLALRAGVPIIPVAIMGSEETVPLLAKLPTPVLGLPFVPVTPLVPLPVKWFIRFGEPLDTAQLPASAAGDPQVVQELTEKTRTAIRSMLQALRQERRSVFG